MQITTLTLLRAQPFDVLRLARWIGIPLRRGMTWAEVRELVALYVTTQRGP